MKTAFFACSILLIAANSIFAMTPVPKPTSTEFELIKSLVGKWSGSAEMEGKKVQTTTSFRLTSGGSAVVETMDEGTAHEMTNIYHLVNGQLMMTHYCSMGNAPEMKVIKSDAMNISFEAIAAHGIDPKVTAHMHGLAYSLRDNEHLTAVWQSANMGKEHPAKSQFDYVRIKEK